MENFIYHNPTKIVFGKDRFEELNNLIGQDQKVLILIGKGSVKKYGTLDKVIKNLGSREYVVFEGIEPNPRYETLLKAIEVVKSEKIDFLIALGGGSVVDGTKFIALGSKYAGDPSVLLLDRNERMALDSAVPLCSILTLPATGSEMNDGGVITLNHKKIPFSSPLVFPVFSILDPTLSYTLPHSQITNGIIDTYVHVTEQYINKTNTRAMFQDRTSEGILLSLIEIGGEIFDKDDNYEIRSNFMWNASMALNSLTGSGVPNDWSSHWIGHEITALYGIDHGMSLSIVMPGVMEVMLSYKLDKLVQYGKRVFGISSGTDEEIAREAIKRTREFFVSIGGKVRLRDCGLEESCIDEIYNEIIKSGYTAMGENGCISLDNVKEILKAIY